jgi:Tfp pilus assembly pilus retraction ATPase PilT
MAAMTAYDVVRMAQPIVSKTKVCNFALSVVQYQWLRRQAFEKNTTQAAVLRGLIDREMKRLDGIQAAAAARRAAR